jgi:hypothetical protein
MAREQNAKVTLTYRLPERLRAKLEHAAQLTDTSLNNEITTRLQKSFDQEDQLGGPQNSLLGRLLMDTIQAAEAKLGRKWFQDPEATATCRAAVEAVLDLVMEIEPEESKLIQMAKDHERRIIANLAVSTASEPITKALLNDTDSKASDLEFFKKGPKTAKRAKARKQ